MVLTGGESSWEVLVLFWKASCRGAAEALLPQITVLTPLRVDSMALGL